MDDKWGLHKVVLLFLLVCSVCFVGAQVHRAQTDLIEIQKKLDGQGKTVQDVAVDLGRIKINIDKLAKGGLKVVGGTTRQVEPADGRILAHGRNCLIDPATVERHDPEAVEGGTLNLHLNAEMNLMTTLLENSAIISDIENIVKSSLYERKFMQEGTKFFGDIAYDLKVTDDYKTYTLKLRDDVFWHTPAVDLNDPKFAWIREMGPQRLTAHDYVFTYKQIILNRDSECSVTRASFDKLDDIEALDDFTLRITWKEKYFPSMVASALVQVLPRFLYGRYEDGREIPEGLYGETFNKHWYNEKMIGTGPYRFVEWEKGKKIVLERNENYHGPRARFDKIVYHVVREAESQLQRFKNGEIDFLELDPTVYAAEIEPCLRDPSKQKDSPFFNGKCHWKKVETPGYSYIGWNQANVILRDKLVRQALTHALPVRNLLKDVWMGYGEEITGPIHKFSPDYDKSLAYIPFDLDKAAALLKQAGWKDIDSDGILEKTIDGKEFEFEVTVVHTKLTEYEQMFAIYRDELLKIGVRLKNNGLNFETLLTKVREKQFDAVAMAWMLVYDTDPYQIWHSSQADEPKGSNRIEFRNAEVDAIIMEARRTFDPEKRSKLFHRFHKIMYDEQPYTLWRARKAVFAWSNKLGKDIRFDTKRPQKDVTEWWDHSLAK